jgi:hypothetical protein
LGLKIGGMGHPDRKSHGRSHSQRHKGATERDTQFGYSLLIDLSVTKEIARLQWLFHQRRVNPLR